MNRAYRSFCAVLAAILSLAGCQVLGPRRPEKAPGSALWLTEGTAPPEPSELVRFQAVGAGELFLEAAVLGWENGAVRLELLPLASTSRTRGATLVVRGNWPQAAEDPELVAGKLDGELRRLRGRGEAEGWLPVGFHFDLDGPITALRPYAETLDRLRRLVDPSLFLSVTFNRGWLEQDEGLALAEAADFLVCFVYGQRPGEKENASAWEFENVERDLWRLESLGRPYLAGVVTVGTASWLDSGCEVQETTTLTSLGQILLSPAFKPKHGFTLQGLDRQVFALEARRGVHVGDWRVRPGDEIRVVRLATYHLASFRRRLEALELEHRLGELIYRLPEPGEDLSLTVANLLNGLAGNVPKPRLEVDIEPLRVTRSRWQIRARLENDSPEPTDFSQISGNYLELRLESGAFSRIDPGGFYRYELLLQRGDGAQVLSLRNPNVLKLYRPFLDGGGKVASGRLEAHLFSPSARLFVQGSFYLPSGETLEVPVFEWAP